MKKIILLLVLICFNFLFAIDVPESDLGKFGYAKDIDFKLIPENIIYHKGEKLNVYFIYRNISNHFLTYLGSLPLDDMSLKYTVKGAFSNEIETMNYYSDIIELDSDTGFSASGGQGMFLKPGGGIIQKFDFAHQTNLYLFNKSSVLTFTWEHELIGDTDYRTGDLPTIGFKKGNSFRLFMNMEQELVKGKMDVEPHKWNVNWEDHPNSGVLTVFLGNIEGYSVKAIDQDTVLYSGTLKPEKIKIVGGHKDMKGKVLMMKFKKSECIEYLGMAKSGETRKINISGQLKVGTWFYGETEVEIVGKK